MSKRMPFLMEADPSGGYFKGRPRIGEVWICQNCGTEFPEYHNGCPKTACDNAPKRGLICVPIYGPKEASHDQPR